MTHRLTSPAPVLLLAVTLAVVLRIPALEMTLDRDLAAYATIGQNLNEGLVPYRDLFDHKQPLSYLVYALLDLLAPRSTEAIRLAAGVAGGITAWLLYVLLLPIAGRPRAAAAAGLALAWGATHHVEGEGLNTEQVLVVVTTGAVLAATRWMGAPSSRRAFAVGVLFGLAVLAKAIGVFMLPALLLAVTWARPHRRRHAIWLLAGGAAPLTLLGLLYVALGGLPDLWYSNFTYNRLYVGTPFGAKGGNLPIVLLTVCAFVAGAAHLVFRRSDGPVWVLVAWLVGASIAAMFSPYALPHYFAPLVPPAAALIAVCVPSRIRRFPIAAAVVVLAGIPAAWGIAGWWDKQGYERSRHDFGPQSILWRDAEALGPEIRARARPGDRMHAVGTDPNYYWLADVEPASQYFYNMPVYVDRPRWLARVERDVCTRLPRFVVVQMQGVPDAPSCLYDAPYVEFARHGRSLALELRPR